MKQLRLLKTDRARQLQIHLAPEIRDELLVRMAEVIEVVFEAQRGRDNEAEAPEDPS